MRRPAIVLVVVASACGLSACSQGSDKDVTHDAGVITASPQRTPGSPSNPLVALPSPKDTRTPPARDRERSAPGADPEQASAGRDADPESGARLSAASTKQSRTIAPRAAAPSKRAAGSTKRADGSRKLLGGTPSLRRPCTLVTRTEAQAILGVALLEPFEAPQGPTCIYRTTSGSELVTLSVQSVDFSEIKPKLRDRRTVSVSGRTAFCGSYGRPMLYLPLSTRRLLSIAASCPVAMRLADAAAVSKRAS